MQSHAAVSPLLILGVSGNPGSTLAPDNLALVVMPLEGHHLVGPQTEVEQIVCGTEDSW